VQHHARLHVAAAADLDGLVVAAQHRVRADAAAGREHDLADHAGALGHAGAGVDVRFMRVKSVDRHCGGSCSSAKSPAIFMAGLCGGRNVRMVPAMAA